MEIKNKPTLAEKQAFWAEQLPNFEAKYWLPSHFELLEFDMEGGNYEVRDVLPEHYSEDDASDIYHRVNTGWAMWKKAINFTKAQAVPEGFVLVPKKPDVDKAWNIALKRIVPPPKTNDVVQKELMCKKYVDDLCFEQDRILLNYEEMIEAQESAPLKLGDLVEPIDHRYTLASGCERYPYAYVVNTNPFQLMSEEGDMYWCCTVEAGGYKLIKSNDQLPEAVSLRMIREGLLSPVETQEQSHD